MPSLLSSEFMLCKLVCFMGGLDSGGCCKLPSGVRSGAPTATCFHILSSTVHMLLASSRVCLLECQEPPDAVQWRHYERNTK